MNLKKLAAGAAVIALAAFPMTTATMASAAPAAPDATNCVATAIDLDGTDASVAPFTGSGTLNCTAPTTFTLKFLVNGTQVKQTTTSTGAGTVNVSGTLTAAEAPGLRGGEKICFEVHSSGAREASGCLITPSPPAGSSDCVGLRADVERFSDGSWFVEAWVRCYYESDVHGVVTVAGQKVFTTAYLDAPPGDIPVFEGLPPGEITVLPGQEVCFFGRPYGDFGYDAVGACDTYDD